MSSLRRRTTGLTLAALLIAVSTGVGVLLAELVLRRGLRSVQQQGYYIWPPNYTRVFRPTPAIMPGVSGLSEFRTNAQGTRGDHLGAYHSYRILALGGSTTICDYLDQTEAWPQLVQDELNGHRRDGPVWVANGGMSGLTTRHHLVALEHLPLGHLRFDALVLLLGVNDLSHRLARDTMYDPYFLIRSEAKRTLLIETFTGTFDLRPGDPFYKRSATWQFLRRLKRVITQRQAAQDPVGEIYVRWRRHRQHSSGIRHELPDLSAALDEYASNVHRIIDIARSHSIRVVLLSQPALWDTAMPPNLEALLWLGGIGDFQSHGGTYYSPAALQEGLTAYNRTLLEICRQRDVECLDLASMLAKDTTTFYDDVHFNEAGARSVAGLVAEYLRRDQPLGSDPLQRAAGKRRRRRQPGAEKRGRRRGRCYPGRVVGLVPCYGAGR